MLLHNPGAVVVWMTDTFKPVPTDGGLLFEIGPPEQVLWFSHGRRASRGDVLRAVERSLPVLVDAAQRDGDHALRELMLQLQALRTLIPTGHEHAQEQNHAPLNPGDGGQEDRDEPADFSRGPEAQAHEQCRD